ncbi:PREDICTED: histidine-rich glycoprotein-like [Nicrophorus vespilloides]|uniref:Histidine-rich glycoprotein-like n=1 Tax=Nicrophorus vespilloides TaxID=110193 RepID=A0ABM1M0K6_NICVS|nr:PREDICTED: histidine-rich glycoprotein-like [Nicrophorus vespilloides]
MKLTSAVVFLAFMVYASCELRQRRGLHFHLGHRDVVHHHVHHSPPIEVHHVPIAHHVISPVHLTHTIPVVHHHHYIR